MQSPRADCHTKADFARSFGHRNEQDVHDADATDDEGYRSYSRQKQRHDSAAAFSRFGDLTQVADREIIRIPRSDTVPACEQLGHLIDGGLHTSLIDRLNVDLINVTGQPPL